MNVSRGKALDVAAFYVAGAVTIAPDAAIAPGAILKAMPGSHLVIGQRVCIGAGVVIQAQKGELILEEGASLGTGVLVMGSGVIGAHACVGAESTLLNTRVTKAEVLGSRSLLGDNSRNPAMQLDKAINNNGATPIHESQTHPLQPENPASFTQSNSNGVGPTTLSSSSGAGTVYGREQITLLIRTLFPHRQPLSTADSENSS
ncbi:MAG: hypothetical protein ACFB0C_21785 [Leptolyngbyaceae cyanobacterium]